MPELMSRPTAYFLYSSLMVRFNPISLYLLVQIVYYSV